MTVYKVPQKDISFILEELVGYDEHSNLPGYEDASSDMVEAILPEAAKFFEEVVAPSNWEADTQPAHLHEDTVVTAPMLDGIYKQMRRSPGAGRCAGRR